MAEMTRDEILAAIASIDTSIATIVASNASVHTVGGQQGHSVNLAASLKELRATRQMYQDMLTAYDEPSFIQTSVDIAGL